MVVAIIVVDELWQVLRPVLGADAVVVVVVFGLPAGFFFTGQRLVFGCVSRQCTVCFGLAVNTML